MSGSLNGPIWSPLDEAIKKLSEKDPHFREELKQRMVPFWEACKVFGKKPWLYDPELRQTAMSIGEWLLEKGMSPNVETSRGGNTILHDIVDLGDNEIVAEAAEWLMRHGADPSLPREDGQTPYTLALRAGNQSVADVMRKNGAKSP
jgi:hypothetical protein